MGVCFSCCTGDFTEDAVQPDPETRRRQMAEAAERRQQEQDSKGVKDADALKRKQQRREESERKSEAMGPNEGGLRWQVG